MVDSIKPTFSAYAAKNNPYKPTQAAAGVESHSEDKQHQQPIWNRVDRRKAGDRRKQQRGKDRKFEMRSSEGRRRTDRAHPSIETKA